MLSSSSLVCSSTGWLPPATNMPLVPSARLHSETIVDSCYWPRFFWGRYFPYNSGRAILPLSSYNPSIRVCPYVSSILWRIQLQAFVALPFFFRPNFAEKEAELKALGASAVLTEERAQSPEGKQIMVSLWPCPSLVSPAQNPGFGTSSRPVLYASDPALECWLKVAHVAEFSILLLRALCDLPPREALTLQLVTPLAASRSAKSGVFWSQS